jgi:hypothetical protein
VQASDEYPSSSPGIFRFKAQVLAARIRHPMNAAVNPTGRIVLGGAA